MIDIYDGLWHTYGVKFARHPAAVSMDPDQEHVLAPVGGGAAVWTAWKAGTGWDRWLPLGTPPTGIAGALAPVSRGPGSFNVYARGQNNALWSANYDGSTWHDWQELDATFTLDSDLAAGSRTVDHEHIFARGVDGNLYEKSWNQGSGYGPWASRGAPQPGLIGGPTTVSRGPSVSNVYVRGKDNALWARSFSGWSWGPWQKVDDSLTLASDPAAASMAADDESVLARGGDGSLHEKVWSAQTGWGPWVSLYRPPYGFTGAPAAVSRGPGIRHVYVQGNDNSIWARAFHGGFWHSWQRLAGTIWPHGLTDVQAAMTGSGQSWLPNDTFARYSLITGWPGQEAASGALSVKNGLPRTWTGADLGGDYLSGGFFSHQGHNYVAQWREPDGIWANIAHVPES